MVEMEPYTHVRKKRFSMVLVRLVLFTFVLLPVFGSESMSAEGNPVTGLDKFYVGPSEMAQLEEQALDGDANAAQRISLHYLMATDKAERGLYWATIAAENGSAWGEYMAGFLLGKNKDADSLRRARFWLKRAMKHGNAGGELLETVEKQLATAQRNGPETTPRK